MIWRPTWRVTLLQQVELEREEVSARSDTWKRGTLWLQKHITEKEIVLRRRKGSENPGDLGTKHLDRVKMWTHVAVLGFEKRDGKSELSLKATLLLEPVQSVVGLARLTSCRFTFGDNRYRLRVDAQSLVPGC